MEQGQLQFQEFILTRVSKEHISIAKQLLVEGFQKQAEGTFNDEYLKEYITKMAPLLKKENQEEVMNIMKNYSQKKG